MNVSIERLAHDYLLRTAAARRNADRLGVDPLVKFARVWALDEESPRAADTAEGMDTRKDPE